MKKLVTLLVVAMFMLSQSNSQILSIVDGFTAVPARQGPPAFPSGYPTVEIPFIHPSNPGEYYCNRFWKLDPATGKFVEVQSTGMGYEPNRTGTIWGGYCANCTVADVPQLYRVVTNGCINGGQDGCFNLDSTITLTTNNCTSSTAWSAFTTWDHFKTPITATAGFQLARSIHLDADFVCQGSLNINAGCVFTIDAGKTFTFNGSGGGGIFSNNGSSIEPAIINNGTLKGNSYLAGVRFTNNSTIAPGNETSNNLRDNFFRSFTATPSSVLNMQVGSSFLYTDQNDCIAVDESSIIGGTLNISFVNGFIPRAGDKYRVLRSNNSTASFTGNFQTVNFPPGVTGQVYYNATFPFMAYNSVVVVITSAPLLPGGAFSFNGNGYSGIPTNNFPVGNSNYTIETWVKSSEDGNRNIIIWGNQLNNNANGLALLQGNKITNYGWFNDLIVDAPTVNNGNWHHIAATYDGTSRKIYMDGVLLGSDAPTGHNTSSGTTGYIGGLDPSNWRMKGILDELRIFSRALTQGEITASMNCEITVNTTGLSAYYKFNQGTAFENNTTVTGFTDASGNGNTTTISYGYTLNGTTSNFVVGKFAKGHGCIPCVPVTSTYTKTNAGCYGTATGSLTVTPTNGVAPYTYRLGTSGTYGSSNTFSNLKAGSYKVYIQDANGCTGITASIVVGQSPAITGTASTSNATCYGTATGSLTVTPTTDTWPYAYRLGTTGSYVASNTFNNLKGGISYRIYIQDANGCVGNIVVMVGQPPAITGTFIKTDVTGCYRGTNGSITVTPTTGTAPYTYKLNITGTYGSSNSFAGLKAGAYKVYVKDAGGCEGIISVTILQPSAVSATATKTDASCPGAKDGSMTINGAGGTGPYTYRFGASGAYTTTNTFTGLKSGSYRVYVQDANNCTGYSIVVAIGNQASTCFANQSIAKSGKTAVEASQPSLNVSLSPNPSSNVFKLTTQTAKAEAIQLSVIDISGKVVYAAKGSPTQTFTFGEALTSGVYLIEVRQGNEVKAMKVIKN